MNQLKLLWDIQEQEEELSKYINEIKAVETGENIEELELKLQQSNYDITNSKTQMDVDNAKIRRHSLKLDELNFKLKELDEKLYSGDITDLNQIEHMNKEIQHLKQLVEELESQILGLMENVENLSKKLIELENNYKCDSNELELAKADQSKNIKKLEDVIKEKEELISESMKHIDEDLLDKYKSLKDSKGKAIVKISDERCTGCHMNIPLTTISNLKKNNSINYCDNCDRILLYVKKQ